MNVKCDCDTFAIGPIAINNDMMIDDTFNLSKNLSEIILENVLPFEKHKKKSLPILKYTN